MKTKDLISELRRLDPSGEMEVVGNDNSDIHFLEIKDPGWDGYGEKLVLDPSIHGYNIVGAGFVEGPRLVLHNYPIEEVLLTRPDLPVDFKGIRNTNSREYYERMIREWRDEAKRIIDETD